MQTDSLMRFPSVFRRAAVGALVLPVMIGCQDELPTATGGDLFPGGTRPTTVELILQPEQFVLGAAQYSDYTSPNNASFLTVAREFDGELTANALTRFTGFPDSIAFTVDGATTVTDEFAYTEGRVVAVVNPAASREVATQLRLWALEQAWDTAGVSWTVAEGRTSPTHWTTPGGTRGQLLAEAVWVPGDTTAAADSIVFEVDSLTMARATEEGYHGMVVTSETAGSRLQISRLVLQATVRPADHDTTLTVPVGGGPQVTIFTPPPPLPDGTIRVGGLTGDRATIDVLLDQQVPTCLPPAAGCTTVSLRDVTINQASLLLTPVTTPGGLRPLQPVPLRVRRVLEPELGRVAPLGELLYADTVTASTFAPGNSAPLSLDLTGPISVFNTRGLDGLTLALLTEPEGAGFGYLYFTDRPRLRIVYTLPLRPTFP
jgi:hypothetical protein